MLRRGRPPNSSIVRPPEKSALAFFGVLRSDHKTYSWNYLDLSNNDYDYNPKIFFFYNKIEFWISIYFSKQIYNLFTSGAWDRFLPTLLLSPVKKEPWIDLRSFLSIDTLSSFLLIDPLNSVLLFDLLSFAPMSHSQLILG